MFTIYPDYSKKRVSKAGSAVREGTENQEDIDVIENWRASHNYVLNTFQATLRRHARGKDITVAQRLKRRLTIYDKLKRQPEMQLARMHDIAGCRLIFEDIASLNETRRQILGSKFKHRLRNSLGDYDYIMSPKKTGYRGVHDVYEYVSYSGSADKWNGLQIELQYRTKTQHAWATAVEIVGSLTGNESKFDRGDEDHQHFFRLSSELLSRHHEEKKSCLPDLTNRELVGEIIAIEKKIGVIRLLEGIHVSAEKLKEARNLILRMGHKGGLTVYGFTKTKTALERYFELEEEEGDDDIVFVRGDTNEGIRSAFRNYFSDARDFTSLMRSALR
ncbi:RelA/SpoT domain-containing protein [Agrobacterium sp. P15N1-A]|uniref:RelA/SpoT domain-containing protein n=1 Tax=Agrobacterium sp. P15N1-A TaxID=3342820 RepID=UPI0037D0E2FE